jgi:DNA modification methylase
MSTRELRIEYLPLEEIREAASNPKEHDLARLDASFARNGFVSPMIVEEDSGKLVAGHGRLEALRKRKAAGKPAPDGIKVAEDGAWLAPVVRGVSLGDKAAGYILADNRLVELGGWNQEGLVLMLNEIAKVEPELLEALRWKGELDLPVETEAEADEEDVRRFSSVPAVCKEGEMWRLGAHRLLCGDTASEDDMGRLTAGRLVDCVLTDPPYAIYGSSSGIGKDIADDKMVLPFFTRIGEVFRTRTKEFGHVYTFCDWRSFATLWNGYKRASLTPKNCIIWDKNAGGLGNNYSNTHEFIAYHANLEPPKSMSSGARTGQRQVLQPNIYACDRVRGEERLHNAAKPVELLRWLLENSTDQGETVLDGFGGSGSTLIAAEKTGRVCYMMELEPKMCDIIIARWERLSGLKAAREE